MARSPSWVHCDRQHPDSLTRTAPVPGLERRKGSRDHIPYRRTRPGRPIVDGGARRCRGVRVPSARSAVGTPWPTAAAGVDLLVIATPDDQVARVASQVAPVDGTVVLHLSGSLGLDVLAPHRRRGSLHPLVPAAHPGGRRPSGWLSGITFAVAGDPMADRVAAALGGRALDRRRRAAHLVPRGRLDRRQPPGRPHRPGGAGGGLGRAAARRLRRPDAGGHRGCPRPRAAGGADRPGRPGRLGHRRTATAGALSAMAGHRTELAAYDAMVGPGPAAVAGHGLHDGSTATPATDGPSDRQRRRSPTRRSRPDPVRPATAGTGAAVRPRSRWHDDDPRPPALTTADRSPSAGPEAVPDAGGLAGATTPSPGTPPPSTAFRRGGDDRGRGAHHGCPARGALLADPPGRRRVRRRGGVDLRQPHPVRRSIGPGQLPPHLESDLGLGGEGRAGGSSSPRRSPRCTPSRPAAPPPPCRCRS